MMLEKVKIQNFKSIKDSGEINFDEKITTLIGKNEQGKTNFLKALESFGREYEYKDEDLCSYSKKEEIEAENIEMVTIWFKIKDEDKNALKKIHPELPKINKLKITKYFDNHYDVELGKLEKKDLEEVRKIRDKIVSRVNALSEKIQSHAQRHPPFASSIPQYNQSINEFLSAKFTDTYQVNSAFNTLYGDLRTLPNKDTQISKDIEDIISGLEETKNELISKLQKNVKEEILKILPNFIYFDSVDLLRDSINIGEYKKNKAKYKTFSNLFNLAGLKIGELTGKPFYKRRFNTDEASATITGMVNESWKQEKVEVNIGIDGVNLFIYIKDEVGARDPPSRRSDGFQWYLSFYINFIAGTKDELKNAVLLLDNPGLLLHASGQRDLLETLEKIAENNQIIFATHSPFLIDKNRLERVRILEKRKNKIGTKVNEKFYDSEYDALEPIRAAIGARVADSLFGSKNNILVEGFSDKLYIEAISKYFSKRNHISLDLSKILINCAGGADKVPWLASFIKAEKYDSLIILDNDNKGRNVIKEIEKRDIGLNENDILKIDQIDDEFKGKDMEMEDLFDSEFFNKAVNVAYKEIFKEKLGKVKISLDDLSEEGLTPMRYEKFFKENNLGNFDKIKIAKEIREITKRKECNDNELGEKTINNFEKLFEIINKNFE